MRMPMDHPIKERLLRVMDRKDHWAWPHLTRAGLSKDQLLAHFRHEFHTYVRDFPVLLARVLGQGPPSSVRDALAENIYEEQSGKLSLGVAHPELFLEMMDGLGLSRDRIERADPPLEAEAKEYRAFLEQAGSESPWQAGAAVLTIFVEGSKHERVELEGNRTQPPVEQAIAEHPLVACYGCPPEKMRLVRAHRLVEGGHRDDAWRMVLDNVAPGGKLEDEVVAAVESAHEAWHHYRDGVARAMGLRP
jgi:pyrroloquinoline-quinone synthase